MYINTHNQLCTVIFNQYSQHGCQKKQEGNVLLEPAAPMFHLLIFGNVSIKNPKIHEIQKSVNSKNPWNPKICEIQKSMKPLNPDVTNSQGFNFSWGSQLFYRKSTFPEEVKFSRGRQLFPRESTFPKGVNFSPRESTFPEEVKFTKKSRFLGSHIPQHEPQSH